jgi:hypothetical protein
MHTCSSSLSWISLSVSIRENLFSLRSDYDSFSRLRASPRKTFLAPCGIFSPSPPLGSVERESTSQAHLSCDGAEQIYRFSVGATASTYAMPLLCGYWEVEESFLGTSTVNTHSTSCSTTFCINSRARTVPGWKRQEAVEGHATLEVEIIYFG